MCVERWIEWDKVIMTFDINHWARNENIWWFMKSWCIKIPVEIERNETPEYKYMRFVWLCVSFRMHSSMEKKHDQDECEKFCFFFDVKDAESRQKAESRDKTNNNNKKEDSKAFNHSHNLNNINVKCV